MQHTQLSNIREIEQSDFSEHFLARRHLTNIDGYIAQYIMMLDPQNPDIINARGELQHTRDEDSLIREAWNNYYNDCNSYNSNERRREPDKKKQILIKQESFHVFEIKFKVFLDQVGQKKLEEYRNRLEFDKSSDDKEIDKILDCLRIPADKKLIWSHWMWLVKSSIFFPNRVKFNPFMLLLVSKPEAIADGEVIKIRRGQQLGKSTFIDKFLSPLSPLTLSLTVKDVTDSRYHLTMLKNYAVFLDEMSFVDRTDISELKKVITMSKASVRPLRSNSIKTRTNNVVFIGAANRRLGEMIHDTTGMRRFYEFQLFEEIKWEVFEKIDFLKAWRSINEHLERGYITEDLLEEIRKEQEVFTETDPLDDFILEFDLKSGSDAIKEWVRSSVISKIFESWCMDMGYQRLHNKSLGIKLKAANIRSSRKNLGSYYLINTTLLLNNDKAKEHLGRE